MFGGGRARRRNSSLVCIITHKRADWAFPYASSVLNTQPKINLFWCCACVLFFRAVCLVVANLSRAHGGDGGGCLMRDSLDHNRFSVVDAMTTTCAISQSHTTNCVYFTYKRSLKTAKKKNNNTTFENWIIIFLFVQTFPARVLYFLLYTLKWLIYRLVVVRSKDIHVERHRRLKKKSAQLIWFSRFIPFAILLLERKSKSRSLWKCHRVSIFSAIINTDEDKKALRSQHCKFTDFIFRTTYFFFISLCASYAMGCSSSSERSQWLFHWVIYCCCCCCRVE